MIIIAFLIISLYIIIAFVFYTHGYRISKEYLSRNELCSITAIRFLRANERYILFLMSALFPLWVCFAIGAEYGNTIYEILINKNNENRIASWVV